MEGEAKGAGQPVGGSIDFSVDVGTLNDAQVDSEMSAIRSDPAFGREHDMIGGNPRSAALQDRLTKLYQKKYPETPERKAETPEAKLLHDTVLRAGLKTVGEIEAGGEEGRREIIEEEARQEMLQAEGQLREELGEEYQGTLNSVHYILDNVLNEKDRQEIIDHFGNDVEMIEALGIVGRKLDGLFWGNKASQYRRGGNK